VTVRVFRNLRKDLPVVIHRIGLLSLISMGKSKVTLLPVTAFSIEPIWDLVEKR
jgi:hypothetical protein